MKIEAFPMQAKEGGRSIEGVVTMPQGSKIVHVGAAPPNGEMLVYAEVSPMKLPDITMDIAVIGVGQEIPNGYEYLGYILAIPVLFIYKRKESSIIT